MISRISDRFAETVTLVRNNVDKIQVGAWGLGNSLVIPAYGVFSVLVVFRMAPEQELGTYLVLQAIYLMTVQLAASFGFVPLVRHFYDKEKRSSVVGSGIILNLAFLLPVMVLLVLLRGYLASLLSCSDFPHLVWLVVAATLLRTPAELRISILQAMHRTKTVFYINMAYHMTIVLIVAGVVMGPGLENASQLLWSLVGASAISSITAFCVPPRGLFHPSFSKSELVRLFHYGKFTLGSGMSGAVFTRMDILILSAFRGPVEVAAYGVSKIFTRFFDVYGHTSNLVVFPFFSRLWNEGRREDMERVFKNVLVVSNIVFVPLVIGLMLVAKPAVGFFYGTKYPSAGLLLMVFSMVGLTVPWRILSHNVVNAAGIPGYVFRARIAISFMNLMLDILLIPRYGALGAIIATLVSLALLAAVLTSKAKSVFSIHFNTGTGEAAGVHGDPVTTNRG